MPIPPVHRVRRRLALGLSLLAVAACAADVDNVLVRSSLVTLVAHDSAHIRTLVLEPVDGARIEADAPPTLERDAGGRIVFSAPTRSSDSVFFIEQPSARVTLTQPVNGTLRLRACPAVGECRAIALPVRTRGRSTRGRS